MNDVQNCDSCINIPSSLTCRSYVNMMILMITSVCRMRNFVMYSYIHAGGSKSYTNRGPVYILEYFKWCGKPCCAGSIILIGRCLPQIPGRDRHISLLLYSLLFKSKSNRSYVTTSGHSASPSWCQTPIWGP
jgi:hypothetical protein